MLQKGFHARFLSFLQCLEPRESRLTKSLDFSAGPPGCKGNPYFVTFTLPDRPLSFNSLYTPQPCSFCLPGSATSRPGSSPTVEATRPYMLPVSTQKRRATTGCSSWRQGAKEQASIFQPVTGAVTPAFLPSVRMRISSCPKRTRASGRCLRWREVGRHT